ncbi:MAG: hypothetical protein RL653_1654, partial [Pseudomonadota bacterium]
KTHTPLAIPYFGLLGNHDYNFHGHAAIARDGGRLAQNMDRAIAQVDYGYRNGARHWHMPYRYYLVTSAHADFFCIDTATLLFDKTQQEWLKTVYAERASNRKWKFLMGHHGYVTFGKRGAGTKAEKDITGLVKTAHTKAAARALAEKGVTSATEEQMAGSAALGLQGNINKHVFTWCVGAGLHFHFNVVAHDHFSASALLTYDFPDGTFRRTYYVLAGGGGAYVGGGSLESLVALGPNCANVDLMEKKHGFATFKVSAASVDLNFRLHDGGKWEDAWDDPKQFRKDAPHYWQVNTGGAALGTALKRVANPVLRGVFLKRGGSGTFSNPAFQRRYFEIEWGSSNFWYGQKPGEPLVARRRHHEPGRRVRCRQGGAALREEQDGHAGRPVALELRHPRPHPRVRRPRGALQRSLRVAGPGDGDRDRVEQRKGGARPRPITARAL